MIHDGTQLGAWASLGDSSAIDYTVLRDHVEFRLGGRDNPFELVVSEDSLERLVDKAAEALAALRAGEHDDD